MTEQHSQHGSSGAAVADLPGHGPSHADSGHGDGGHLTLTYEPGLPLSNSKLIIWLFLSTEIMFFAALIGVFIVIRFGAPAWPMAHEVFLSEPIGAFNTFVLICSSVSIVLALEAARANKAGLAKGLMVLTLLLGSLFLIVKGFEYNHKFEHGIYPMAPRSRIYERPDLYFGSAVRERLNDAEVQKHITELKGAPSGQLTKFAKHWRSSTLSDREASPKRSKTRRRPQWRCSKWPTRFCRLRRFPEWKASKKAASTKCFAG